MNHVQVKTEVVITLTIYGTPVPLYSRMSYVYHFERCTRDVSCTYHNSMRLFLLSYRTLMCSPYNLLCGHFQTARIQPRWVLDLKEEFLMLSEYVIARINFITSIRSPFAFCQFALSDSDIDLKPTCGGRISQDVLYYKSLF